MPGDLTSYKTNRTGVLSHYKANMPGVLTYYKADMPVVVVMTAVCSVWEVFLV